MLYGRHIHRSSSHSRETELLPSQHHCRRQSIEAPKAIPFRANRNDWKSTIGDPDPWGEVIKSLWAALLGKVEEAWSSLGPLWIIAEVPSLRSPTRACHWNRITRPHTRRTWRGPIGVAPWEMQAWFFLLWNHSWTSFSCV